MFEITFVLVLKKNLYKVKGAIVGFIFMFFIYFLVQNNLENM